MSAMENRDEVLQMLERFTRLKQKEIPRELEDYLSFVARTGDTVYPWPAVKYFFRTKLSIVIMDFHDNTPSIADLPQCPNVDPFYYDRMKQNLLSRMDSFNSAPFTIQRICELLNEPRKHYTRIDKFMRAVEKNILVVSTQEPGRRRSDSENGDSLDSIVNGDLEVNVDIEMDNEAFGIDSNEMVPNVAAVATEALIPPITTPACAEEVPPMESSEEQDQGPEKHESESAPELALTDNGVETGEANEASTVEALPKEIKETEKDVPETEDQTAGQKEKHLNSDEVEPTSPEPSALGSKEAPLFNVVDSVTVSDVDDPKEATVKISHDTSEPAVTVDPPVAVALETEKDSIDNGEPKAKMAKLSQEAPERQTELKPTTVPVEKLPTDPDKDAVSSESTTDSNGSNVESNNSPEERTETDVLSSSVESTVTNVDVSSEEISGTETTKPSSSPEDADSIITEVSSVEPEEKKEQIKPERPAKQTTPDEPHGTEEHTSEAPSESAATAEPAAHVEEENGETIVQRINLEETPASANESEPYTASRVNSDDMETLSSTVIPENVMATDEEEQPQQGAVDVVVPMAADASELAKLEENAMDIDESSVEPMDQ